MSLLLALAMALAGQDNGTGGPGDRWQSIDATSGFPQWRRAVRRYVGRYAKHRVNHLCVIVGININVGQPDDATAYLHWPEQHTIELLGATDDPFMSDLLFSQGPIDLRRDIINPLEPVNLNPNAVSQAWVNQLIARCRRDGTQLTIIKRR